MNAPWLLPFTVVIGLAGTRTYLDVRHGLRMARDKATWLLPVLSWWPLVCWILSQFIRQD
jgi:hypothetical protein